MESISLNDLPEPFARAIQAMVETLRRQLQTEEKPRRRVELPKWRGTVIGSLRREDLYSDAI
jgi:hypothetical protein